MTDIRDVLKGLPYPPDDGTSYALTDLFTARHQIIRGFSPPPKSVFEFGALKGFFLVTALDAAPSIERVGWVDNEQHTLGSNGMCLENVVAVAPTLGHAMALGYSRIYLDRDQIARDPTHGRFDLVQIDSDHSYQGCLEDLRAASLLEPRWIMVDDWAAQSHTAEVQGATRDWLEEQNELGVQWVVSEHETVNGLALLTRLSA